MDKIKRIVIDCTEKEHRKYKAFCAENGKDMKDFGLKAILKAMEEYKRKEG